MKILSRLLNNCRESDRQIGKELGISGGAVRVRIKKMQDSGIIEKFFLKIEPPILGHGVLYFVVSGENVQEILEQVSLVGEPYIVVPCVGGVTVCGIAVQENLGQKIELAKKLMKDLRVLSIFEAENSVFKSNLTKTDLEILEELIKEPRQKIEKIAKNTNLSTKTVTRSIEKLHKNGIEDGHHNHDVKISVKVENNNKEKFDSKLYTKIGIDDLNLALEKADILKEVKGK